MGIDLIAGGRSKNKNDRKLRTPNLYYRLAVKLYRFLSRRTDSKFNKLVLKRLINSRTYRAPVSIARLTRFAAKKHIQELETKYLNLIIEELNLYLLLLVLLLMIVDY
jgi:large subunit ribosomal protein L18e